VQQTSSNPSNVVFSVLPQGTSVLSPSIPLTLVVLPALMIAQKSPQNIFTEHASVYILAFGMVAAKVTNKLVVSPGKIPLGPVGLGHHATGVP